MKRKSELFLFVHSKRTLQDPLFETELKDSTGSGDSAIHFLADFKPNDYSSIQND